MILFKILLKNKTKQHFVFKEKCIFLRQKNDNIYSNEYSEGGREIGSERNTEFNAIDTVLIFIIYGGLIYFVCITYQIFHSKIHSLYKIISSQH